MAARPDPKFSVKILKKHGETVYVMLQYSRTADRVLGRVVNGRPKPGGTSANLSFSQCMSVMVEAFGQIL